MQPGCNGQNHMSHPDAAVTLADITTTRPSCPASPPRVVPSVVLRHRVYNISTQPDLRVLWRHTFRAFEGEAPQSSVPLDSLCRALSKQQWPYCRGSRIRQHNTLMLVSMPCAYTDAGSNYRGALYDDKRVLNAQHRGATPRFALDGPIRRYEVAAVGLTPYGHLADAHFYASTAAWVLTLHELLPLTVPILVATNSKLSLLYAALGLPAERLHTLPPRGAAYAKQLLSLVTTPFGALEPLGAPSLRRVRHRLLSRLLPRPPPTSTARHVVVLSRNDQAPRRSLRNQPELLRALRAVLTSLNNGHVLDVFQANRLLRTSPRHADGRPLRDGWQLAEDGRKLTGGHTSGRRLGATQGGGGGEAAFATRLTEAAALFSQAALVTGPHGGGFLNIIYCHPGTPVVEIGYTGAQPMAYPSYYHTMARRLGLSFWLLLGSGGYDRPITAPVTQVTELVRALLGGAG